MLLSVVMGTVGFIMFFLYDINSFTIKKRFVGSFFFIGCGVLVCASAVEIYSACEIGAFVLPGDLFGLIGAIVSLGCLVYCLFFALPFDKTYVEQKNGRGVYDRGVYALCRHPGVLCFFAFFLFLGIAAKPYPLWQYGMYLSVLNYLYVLFQDAVTFPKTFHNYAEYRKYTPFIIPTKKSICRSIRTMKRENRKGNIE